MNQIAFLFSGQGAQYSGMGKELYGASPAAKAVFDLADTIRPNTSSQCFTAPKEELNLTVNTQPCLYCVDLAAAAALREHGIKPAFVAGFSLGEIAALTFSGVLSEEDGFSLVCRRASYMGEATAKTGGGMCAVLKLSSAQVEEICGKFQHVFPVNYNCPGQIAVAGDKEELAALGRAVQEAGGKAVPLAVSGAFHSPFMDKASEKMAQYLTGVPVTAPKIPLYSNYTAGLYGGGKDEIRKNIALQINHPVRWQAILESMAAQGVGAFVEVGAGKTLTGLVKKTVPSAKALHVENAASLEAAVNTLKQED